MNTPWALAAPRPSCFTPALPCPTFLSVPQQPNHKGTDAGRKGQEPNAALLEQAEIGEGVAHQERKRHALRAGVREAFRKRRNTPGASPAP